MAHIYVITNSVNDKLYVGQTSLPIEDRWNAHVNSYRKFERTGESPTKLKRAMLKYGLSNFKIFSILECEDSELDDFECYYIKALNSKFCGYNMTDGGGGTRGFKWSNESRKKLSDSISGANSYNFGKTLPDHIKAKISQALSGDKNPFNGRTHTDDVRKRISEAHKGKKLSEEHKAKLSNARLGKNNPRFGKPASELAIRRAKEVCSKQVTIEGISYTSMKDACKQLDTSYPTIHKYLSGEIDRISVYYEGNTYTSVNALAKHLGLSIVKVCGMIGKGRWK